MAQVPQPPSIVKLDAKDKVKENAKEKKKEEKEQKGKKGKKNGKENEKLEDVFFSALPKDAQILDEYWVSEPFARVRIISVPERGGGYAYYIDETLLEQYEQKALDKLVAILGKELSPPESSNMEAKAHVLEEARRLLKKYKSSLGKVEESSWNKLQYYMERDLIGFGPINVIMLDPLIEDCSCDGVGHPVYVWHRKYESIPTNLTIVNKASFSNFIIKLAHFAGKHVSSAFPIVDAMLPGNHRLAATYGEEVSPKGSTFTVRKFREQPYSIIDLIELGTLSIEMAAYYWLILESRLTLVIMGGTAAGKTSALNALATLFKPGLKIITVEETAELNIPHENWVQFISRESYGLGTAKLGSIGLFDLVKTSLRYRPDYIMVGEVRGEEAFVLFQAMATGHGGLTTLHAENLDYAIKRLTSPPMNVAPAYIPLMNVAVLQERVYLPKRVGGVPFGRRMRYVWEIYKDGSSKVICEWDPVTDSYNAQIEESKHLADIAARIGKTRNDYLEELARREAVLQWMRDRKIKDYKEVAKIITQYYMSDLFTQQEKAAPTRAQPR